MVLSDATTQVLLTGHGDGHIVLRKIDQVFTPILKLDPAQQRTGNGHMGKIKVLSPATDNIFFSGADDGKMCVWKVAPEALMAAFRAS